MHVAYKLVLFLASNPNLIMKPICHAGAKMLKGADKEIFNDLSVRVGDAGKVAVKACISFNIIPFLSSLLGSITDADDGACVMPRNALENDACIFHMKGAVNSKVMEALNAFHRFVPGFVPKLELALGGGLEATASRAALLDWEKQAAELLQNLKECCVDPKQLEETVEKVTQAIADVLQGRVKEELATKLGRCLAYVDMVNHEIEAGDNAKPLPKEEGPVFEELLRECRALSSVLGDVGAKVREGLLVVEAGVGFYMAFCQEGPAAETEKLRKQDFHIMSLFLQIQREQEKGKDVATPEDSVMGMIQLVRCPGIDQQDFFKGKIGRVYSETLDQCMKVVGTIQNDLREEIGSLRENSSNLTLPAEILNVSKLEDVFEMKELILEKFGLEVSNQVADCAVGLEKALKTLNSTAKKLRVEPEWLCDEARCFYCLAHLHAVDVSWLL